MNKDDRTTIQIVRKASEAIDQIAQRTGLQKKHIVEMVFCWLTAQDEVVQALILGQIPEALQRDAARLALERLAKNKTTSRRTASGRRQ
ncbi:MAG: hypothetical protein FWD53_08330 [Phycisphaerales bacterium]|nr:hypothetical protein [Phycisphaerales bacterium]